MASESISSYLNGLRPFELTRFAQQVEKVSGTCASTSAKLEAAKAVAEVVASRANNVLAKAGANSREGIDGNKATAVAKRSGSHKSYAAVLESRQFEGSPYPDAYYLEYGYGWRNAGAYQKRGGGPYLGGYGDKGIYGVQGRGRDDKWVYLNRYTRTSYTRGVGADGKRHHNWSEGLAPLMPMYKATKQTRADLKNKNSRVTRKVLKSLGLS